MTKKAFSTIILALYSLLIIGQENPKYLEGAVPLVDNKVVFTRTIDLGNANIPKATLFKLAQDWVEEEFKYNEKSEYVQRVLLVNPEEDYIVCQGDQYLVFKSSALMIDRTKITYRFILNIQDNKYEMLLKNIKYEYQDYDKPVAAEELIVDKIALNKEKTKLNRHYDKFRIFTIDMVDGLKSKFEKYLRENAGTPLISTHRTDTVYPPLVMPRPGRVDGPMVVLPTPIATPTDMTGYKVMKAEDLSESITNMFKDNWALVVTGTGSEHKIMPGAWSGIGNFGGKHVSMALVNTTDNQEETYTISFFTPIHKTELNKLEKEQTSSLTPITTPSGAQAYAEAWIIIECKKVLEQPATEQMIKDMQSKKWNATSFNKLYMGEIINIWAR